jgi:tRNA (guanine37-N1)-methyltransferase
MLRVTKFVRAHVGGEKRMRFDVLTLFPAIFTSYLGESLLKKAVDRGLVQVHVHDLRDWSRDKHHKVDDRPFGGGPGMLLRVEPVVEGVEAVQDLGEPGHVVLMTPQGRKFDQRVAEEFARRRRLLLVCGRYEGFDQRVIDILQPDELSIGDFVLNGGEVAAMAVMETVARLTPGVLGDEDSHIQDSFSGDRRLLECAQYTRPREYRGRQVPEVLLSGDHEAIARWRQEQGDQKTRERRADLIPPESAPPHNK